MERSFDPPAQFEQVDRTGARGAIMRDTDSFFRKGQLLEHARATRPALQNEKRPRLGFERLKNRPTTEIATYDLGITYSPVT